MVGFPSVGKSTVLNKLTETRSAVASYEFTTLCAIPGVIQYKGAKIQLLDLPGIIEVALPARRFHPLEERDGGLIPTGADGDPSSGGCRLGGGAQGASEGKGRGRQVVATAKTADLVLMILDAANGDVQKRLLQQELDALERRGIRMNSSVQLTQLNERIVFGILHDYHIFNAEVNFHEDASVDDFIDVIEGTRVYLPCLYVFNKIDTVTLEEVDRLAREPDSMVVSCEWGLNLDRLVDRIWRQLDLVRIYTKKRAQPPAFNEPLIVRRHSTILDICRGVHRTLQDNFKYALLWGTSAKYSPQRVGFSHVVEDEDVVQIVKKSNN
ncbi:putative Developmentally-regulated GTP-binding protein 2 [Paratrimastix pyriformis]|uniref:Developmentally-regulated GTP-binding protein 2 n=1 Tax=Paratrimastix pyriformis TaxID=342808 RepID=A0ABQ8UM67_9EUKA|nr:putative Developmentally-regulated GTP-binding protein 2 [Paratrimastix pyriformis]